MDGSTIVALVVSIALAITLILLIKKQTIDSELLTGTAEVIQQLPVQEGSGVFGVILKYAATAVLTVEQLVKTGKIGKSDKERKAAAMEIVEKAAEVDKIEYGENERHIASACIEAEVQKLPRNQGNVIEIPAEMIMEGIEIKAAETDAGKPAEMPTEPAEEQAQAPEEEAKENEAPGDTEAPPDAQDAREGA